jgi:hypothetical protein
LTPSFLPTTGNKDCYACELNGHATAAPPPKSVLNSRRRMMPRRLKSVPAECAVCRARAAISDQHRRRNARRAQATSGWRPAIGVPHSYALATGHRCPSFLRLASRRATFSCCPSLGAPRGMHASVGAGLPQCAHDLPQFSGPSTILRETGSALFRTQPSLSRSCLLGSWRHRAVDLCVAAVPKLRAV